MMRATNRTGRGGAAPGSSGAPARPRTTPRRPAPARRPAPHPVFLAVAAAVVAALVALCAVGFGAFGGDGASTRVYEYRIEGLDGSAYRVTETASFGEDGFLEQSSVTVAVPDQATGERLLAQMREGFGDLLVAGQAVDKTVVVVAKPSRSDISADEYDRLMREAAS